MEVKQHYDASKYGSPSIGKDEPGIRILDLIHWFQGPPHELPLLPAAEAVLDALEALGDQLPLYRTGGNGWAQSCALHRTIEVQTGTRLIDPFHDDHFRRKAINADGGWRNEWLSNYRVAQPRRVPVMEQESVSWLASIRRSLASHGNGSGLKFHGFVRLVIPRRLADSLFGCGPAVSYWERQPEPYPLQGPGMYPPPELQGIRPHDADRWGEMLTRTTPPRAVVRVADLVQFAADQAGVRAVRDVAAHVLQAIDRESPGLFMLNQGSMAEAVEPGYLWRRRFMSGKEHESEWQAALSDGVFGLPSIDFDEAEARGLQVADDDRRRNSGGSWHRDWLELPELIGPAGALQLAQEQWAERARTFADLDAGTLGRLAVPLAWAVAKFGRQAAQLESDGPTAQIELTEAALQIPTEQAQAAPVAVDAATARKAQAWEVAKQRGKDGEWEDCHLKAVEELRQLKISDTAIAKGLGISRTRLQQACGTLADFHAKMASDRTALAGVVRALGR